jgi:hypothetical protein
MEAQLGVELVLEPSAAAQALPPGHAAPPFSAERRIRRIATDSLSQLAVSVSR